MIVRRDQRAACALVIGMVAAATVAARAPQEPPIELFFAAAGTDGAAARRALDVIAASWRDGHAARLVGVARLLPSPRRRTAAEDRIEIIDGGVSRGAPDPGLRPLSPGAAGRRRLTAFLEEQTGQRFGDDLRA